MKKIIFFTILSFVFLVLLYSFTIKNEQTVKVSVNSTISGGELYLKNCASCHGKNKEGNLPVFPALEDIKKRKSKEEIRTLLKTGRNAMPSFIHLSAPEREAIIGYLYGEETFSTVIIESSTIESGKQLFIANCATCHKVKPEDTEPIGVRNYGMRPATLGGINKSMSLDHFKRILNMGPCYMPSFTHLSTKDKGNIYEYLSRFEYKKRQYKHRNCRCRMN